MGTADKKASRLSTKLLQGLLVVVVLGVLAVVVLGGVLVAFLTESGPFGSGDEPKKGRAFEDPDEELRWLVAASEDLARLRAENLSSDELANEYMERLVEYLNALAIPLGMGEQSEETTTLIRLWMDENIYIAREHIEKGGDYHRALEILESSRDTDPTNERLSLEIEKVRSLRYMTASRFAAVENGMSEDEVREVLGPVYIHNIREYPEKQVLAWFYMREDGGAAGVFFEKRSGPYQVYMTEFDAVEKQE